MRLTDKEIEGMVQAVRALDQNAKIFLFGSRVHGHLTGGDIDLLVLSDTLSFSDKVSLLVNLKKELGDQRIDLLIKPHQAISGDPFVESILRSAKELSLKKAP
jgi:predicted nucleotidyltransferase